MMPRSTPTTITLLLATAMCTQLVKACPLSLSGKCTEECHACQVAKKTTKDTHLNVNATLRDFVYTPDQFKLKVGKQYDDDRIPGVTQLPCYSESNQTVGCSQFIEVEGISCTGEWKYTCDYNKNRLPLYMWKAECNSATSETIYYPVPVLKRDDSCNPQPTWQLVMEKVPVACVCKK